MRITSKGQITIPQEIREKLKLFPGVEVEFNITKNGILLTKAKDQSFGKQVINHLRNKATVKMSTDEIMALTRGS